MGLFSGIFKSRLGKISKTSFLVEEGLFLQMEED